MATITEYIIYRCKLCNDVFKCEYDHDLDRIQAYDERAEKCIEVSGRLAKSPIDHLCNGKETGVAEVIGHSFET